MNRNLKIKYFLPGNMGALRNIGIYINSYKKEKMMPGHLQKIEIDNSAQIFMVKMDYWKTKINLPEKGENLYAIVFLKGQNPIIRFLNSFTRSALIIKLVSQAEFEQFDASYYNEQSIPISKIDSPSFLLVLGLIFYFTYLNFRNNLSEDIQYLLWGTFIIGITTLIVLWSERKRVSIFTYKTRMIVLSALLFGVTIYLLSIGLLNLGWLLILIPPSILARTLMITKDIGFQSDKMPTIKDAS